MTPAKPATTALVRPPADSFAHAESRHPDRDLIKPAKARVQHQAYCAALLAAGAELVALPPNEAYPDACFTQDTAVVLNDCGLVGRFGVESRRGEEAVIQAFLEERLGKERVALLGPPATLEGGDVLVFDDRVVVGRSRRTNAEGIEVLRRVAEPLGFPVYAAGIPSWALHLTTAATAVGGRTVLGPADVLAQEAFRGLDRLVVPDAQRPAGNVLWLGDHVIAAGRFSIHRELAGRGYTIHRVDLSEFNLADGSPTCLSLLIRPAA